MVFHGELVQPTLSNYIRATRVRSVLDVCRVASTLIRLAPRILEVVPLHRLMGLLVLFGVGSTYNVVDLLSAPVSTTGCMTRGRFDGRGGKPFVVSFLTSGFSPISLPLSISFLGCFTVAPAFRLDAFFPPSGGRDFRSLRMQCKYVAIVGGSATHYFTKEKTG